MEGGDWREISIGGEYGRRRPDDVRRKMKVVPLSRGSTEATTQGHGAARDREEKGAGARTVLGSAHGAERGKAKMGCAVKLGRGKEKGSWAPPAASR
jgi:hypothetical protein